MSNDTCRDRLTPASRAEWRAWLESNHGSCTGVLLVTLKKNGEGPGVRYEEAVEEALAFGWIDSRVNALDERSFCQLYTPRRQGSIWSKSNKERVARLTAEGKMAPAGLAAVEAAKRDGSWETLDRVEAMVLPDELARALEADTVAAAGFEALADSVKKQIIYWVGSAKRADTRERRAGKAAESAREGRSPF